MNTTASALAQSLLWLRNTSVPDLDKALWEIASKLIGETL